jgi:hypothetical protein
MTTIDICKDMGIDIRVDIRHFCSRDETRTELMYPWEQDGVVYASDGRVIVYGPPEIWAEGWTRDTDAEPPNAPALIELNRKRGTPSHYWTPYLLTDRAEMALCDECHGTGGLFSSASTPCDACDGKGWTPKTTPIATPAGVFDQWILERLQFLQPVRLGIYSSIEEMGTELSFAEGKGGGWIMPIKGQPNEAKCASGWRYRAVNGQWGLKGDLGRVGKWTDAWEGL